MKTAVITPARLRGGVPAQPSKSALHRALICAALARGRSRIAPVELSDDIEATVGAVTALGAIVEAQDDALVVDGTRTFLLPQKVANCNESGSTLRFLIPVAAAGGLELSFTGAGRLPSRPLDAYLDCLPKAGVRCSSPATGGNSAASLPLTISGNLQPGEFRIPGDISSQFITGLLLALPLVGGDSEIVVTTPLQSASYVDLTVDMMAQFGVEVEKVPEKGGARFRVPGRQQYRPRDCRVEGDWSQAAFWLSANALGSEISCPGLLRSSRQGDKAVLELLQGFGALVDFEGAASMVRGASLHGGDVDAAQVPDLVPALAVVAAFSAGHSVIRGAGRLRFKESDRLHAVCAGLQALGANVRETEDGLDIHGRPALPGGQVDGAGDHRIVMALAVAATRCRGPVVIKGCECISKSYPAFFEHYNKLGGDVRVVDMG